MEKNIKTKPSKTVVFISPNKRQITSLFKYLKSCEFDVTMDEQKLGDTDVTIHSIATPNTASTKQKYLKVEGMKYVSDNYLDSIIMLSNGKTLHLTKNLSETITR